MIVSEARDQPISEVYEVLTKLLVGAHHTVRQSSALSTDGILKIKPAVERCLTQVESYHLIVAGSDAGKRIAAPDYDWLRQNPKVQIRVAGDDSGVAHWVIVDEKNMRLEKPHEAPTVGGNPPSRSNVLVIDCTPELSKEAVGTFESWWVESTPLSAWSDSK